MEVRSYVAEDYLFGLGCKEFLYGGDHLNTTVTKVTKAQAIDANRTAAANASGHFTT